MQYFLGLKGFRTEPLFDASMLVHFRKRFPIEDVAKINEYVCTGRWRESERNVDRNDQEPDMPESDHTEENGASEIAQEKKEESKKEAVEKRKKHVKKEAEKAKEKSREADHRCNHRAVKYPTDLDLLNQFREHLERAINLLEPMVPHTSHKYSYSVKKARKAYLKLAKSKK